MFTTCRLAHTKFQIFSPFYLLFANAFKLDQSKSLLLGKQLKISVTLIIEAANSIKFYCLLYCFNSEDSKILSFSTGLPFLKQQILDSPKLKEFSNTIFYLIKMVEKSLKG